MTPAAWLSALGAVALVTAVAWAGVKPMVLKWWYSEEYGYGLFIPALILGFVWLKRDQLERLRFDGSWVGVLIVFAGLFLMLVGELSTLFIVIQYAFLIVLFGLALAFTGWPAFKVIVVPLSLLFFAVPLPQFLYQGLSTSMQLVSSELGVAVIRLFGISVLLEGNVIDLGSYRLQVAEACNGLRYLFPLTALSFIAAYLFKGAFWKKVVIFVSSVPITIFMNSFRIAVIGVLVDRWGTAMAEGFLHDFEGWVIFMACIGLLAAEMWVLAKVGTDRHRSLGDAFRLDLPVVSGSAAQARTVPRSFRAAFLLLAAVAVVFSALPAREEQPLERKDFARFPMVVGDRYGTPGRMEAIYLDTLKLSDYLLANYSAPGRRRVNLYVAFYDSQRKGESAHSPRSCIPAGGWEITSLEQRILARPNVSEVPLRVNRAVIQKGESRTLVYYWFQQRGRVITNEYLVKWYLFWDALTRNRTDGALVRLTTSVNLGADLPEADRELTEFAMSIAGRLPEYIPD